MANLENANRFSVQESYSPPYNQFNGITSSGGAHFILRVDHILIKPVHRQPIIDGVKRNNFPKIPIDYGFRDNNNFWLSKFKRPYKETIPKGKGSDVNFVKYNANRIDPDVKFTDEACEDLVKVPKIFLKKALNGCVDWAKEHEVSMLTSEHMAKIRNKRAGED